MLVYKDPSTTFAMEGNLRAGESCLAGIRRPADNATAGLVTIFHHL